MTLRLAWLGDWEYADSYLAREARVLLKGCARSPNIIPLWFAIGPERPPYLWNGVRVFSIAPESLSSAGNFESLLNQQRPDVLICALPDEAFPNIFSFLNSSGQRWFQRLAPSDVAGTKAWTKSVMLISEKSAALNGNENRFLPYIRDLSPSVASAVDATEVLSRLQDVVVATTGALPDERRQRPAALIMRQHLFSNVSLSYVMFELCNALKQLGIYVVAQDEMDCYSRRFIRRQEGLYRRGAREKYERIRKTLKLDFDFQTSQLVQFTLIKAWRSLPSLFPRESLYVTGNQCETIDEVKSLGSKYDKILTASNHVLRQFLDAGLNERQGAVIPHGVDPMVFRAGIEPLRYDTKRRFKFLQTSFPFHNEKGFDLSIKAFSRAFTDKDDVSLIIRIPSIDDPDLRSKSVEHIGKCVREECSKAGAPEIVMVEGDVGLNHRGGVYAGADCYVFPLRGEGFGMTILEAMACGLPVIATAWSGPADFLSPRWAYTLRHTAPIGRKDTNGKVYRYQVEPDLEHLISLMRHVYSHQEEAKAIGQKASAVVHSHWTWKHAACKLAEVLGIPAPHSAAKEAGLEIGNVLLRTPATQQTRIS